MDSLAQTARFVVGVGMVAAGSALVVPTALHLLERAGPQTGRESVLPPAVETDWQARTSPWPAPAPLPSDTGFAVAKPRLEYVPPPTPPVPLPPEAPVFSAGGPDLPAGYRPTLQSPPPPLLDAEKAPPLALGWTPRHHEPWSGAGHLPSFAPDHPRIYVIRDGDDLTGIASRFYGHPAAASVIWDANRGLLRDPGVLPIGATLVLPPQSAVAAVSRPTDHTVIEPVPQARFVGPTVREPLARPVSWLSGNQDPTGLAPPSP